MEKKKETVTVKDGMEKTSEEIALLAKAVINILAENECTIEEADNVLRIAKLGIDNTSTVQKLNY